MRTVLLAYIFILFHGNSAGPDNFGRKFKLLSIDEEVKLEIRSKDSEAEVTLNSINRDQTISVSSNANSEQVIPAEENVDITSTEDISVILKYGKSRSVISPLSVMQNAERYLLPKLPDKGVTVVVASNDGVAELSIGEENSKVESNERHTHDVNADSILTASAPLTVLLKADTNMGLNLQPVSLMGTRFLLNENDGADANVMASANIECKMDGKDLTLVKGESQNVKISGLELLECTFSKSGEKAGVQVIQVKGDVMSLAVPTVQYGLEHEVTLQNDDDKVEITTRDGLEDEIIIDPDDLTKDETEKSNGFAVLTYSGPTGDYIVSNKNPTARMNVKVISSDQGSVPSTSALTQTGDFCQDSVGMANDGVDNDCDGWIDEELHNYKDTDSDGAKDEDIAENEEYPAVYPEWMTSWTVLILVILFFLLLVLIAICHWQCSKCEPKIEAPDDHLMVASYDSRMINYRYSMSGSVNGFTLSRR